MKTALVAGALAGMASADSKFMSKLNRPAMPKDAEAKKAAALEVEAILKAESHMTQRTHFNDPGKYFEMVYAMPNSAGNCDDVMMLQGFQSGRCMNEVRNEEGADGYGHTMSHILVEPNNDGFPLVVSFDGHGCVPDNFYDVQRMPKQHMNFPSTYRAGTCVPVYADDGTTVMYMRGARWTRNRHEPDYPAVMKAIDTKHKTCKKEKYYAYEVQRAGICIPEEDGFVQWDVSTCSTGTSPGDYVTQTRYSDPWCNTQTDIERHIYEECIFNAEEFFEHFPMDQDGESFFEYTTKRCFNPPMGPN